MVKKEAKEKAEKMFLKAKGSITNKKIADTVGVNPLTIGRWKKEEDWAKKLKAQERQSAKQSAQPASKKAVKEEVPIIRKKGALAQAVREYLMSGGKITNKDLALVVGVSPATISKWKESPDWADLVNAPDKGRVKESAAAEIHMEEVELDIGELTAPEHILQMNDRLTELLQRQYLSAGELADLAEAKSDLLEAVEIYLGIVRDVTMMDEI